MAEKVELSRSQYDLLMQTMDLKDDGKANGSYHGPQGLSGKSSWYHLSDKEYAALTKALGHKAKPHILTKAEAAFAAKTRLEAKNLNNKGNPETPPKTDDHAGPDKAPDTSGGTGSGNTGNTSGNSNAGSTDGTGTSSTSGGVSAGVSAKYDDPFARALATNQETIDTIVKEIADHPNMTAAQLTAKQQEIEKTGRAMTALTNISKTIHELLMSIIRNFH